MRVLWFEVTVPSSFKAHGFHGGGWQDSLEGIIKGYKNIELGIAFESKFQSDIKEVIDGIHYFPLNPSYNIYEKLESQFTWKTSRDKLIPATLKTIKEFKPDIIHVFGSEWCFGQVAELVDIPVVIHMQGSIPPYNNAFYPPGYNGWNECVYNLTHFRIGKLLSYPIEKIKRESRKKQEEKTLKTVSHYMGRTDWDKGIIELFNPEASYFHCDEALRPVFLNNSKKWQPTENVKLRLTTTGCSSLWKGLDTIVRTSKLLKERKVDFEWYLVGDINHQGLVEWKENVKMKDVNIILTGMINSNELMELLLQTDIYVHTAYIDNSPNSICEAQYLGLPIIATYVGGIPSLIEKGKDGMLVPSNAPYTLANEIIKLSKDSRRLLTYSMNAREKAIKRHNPFSILKELLYVYDNILADNK